MGREPQVPISRTRIKLRGQSGEIELGRDFLVVVVVLCGPHESARAALIGGGNRSDKTNGPQKQETTDEDHDPFREDALLLLSNGSATALFVFFPASTGAGIITTCLRCFH